MLDAKDEVVRTVAGRGMHKACTRFVGHVFAGEGYATPTDKRYCINGVALKFVPEK